jgi:hypothetical protein
LYQGRSIAQTMPTVLAHSDSGRRRALPGGQAGSLFSPAEGKETMRRGLLLMTSLVLSGAILGCKTHGTCDCYDSHPVGTSASIAAHPGNPMPPAAGVPGISPYNAGPMLKPQPIQ